MREKRALVRSALFAVVALRALGKVSVVTCAPTARECRIIGINLSSGVAPKAAAFQKRIVSGASLGR
jgi:hypothetical protein